MVLSWILIVAMMFNPDNGGASIYQKNIKRTTKVISKLWEDQAMQVTPVEFNQTIISEHGLKTPELYNLLSDSGEAHAYMCMRSAPSKADDFTYMVIYDLDFKVKHVEVLEYRENYGGEISSKRFLRQFQGSDSSNRLIMGEHVDGITGATISVKSIVHSINVLNKQLSELKSLGAI